MADAAWKMTDEGEWELNEPYATQLEEARVAATQGWYSGLMAYLEPRCPYDGDMLKSELLRRNEVREGGKVGTFEEFVLEALSGDL